MSDQPSSTPPANTIKFSDAYRRLQGAAKRIEAAAEDDLDTVLDVVREAKEMKAVCSQRLQAATEELSKLLEEPANG